MAKKKKSQSKSTSSPPAVKGPWRIHFFQRHKADDPMEDVPGRTFLDACPPGIAARLLAVVKAVADSPPPMFSGGGMWEAMHDEMKGYFEVRVGGEDREHFRLFCLLDRNGADVGLGGPSLVIVAGARKKFRTTLSKSDYAKIRRLGEEFQSRRPRSVAK